MKTPTILPVILCGGSGTRLWPLSRKSFPKQFVPVVGGKNLLQMTFERLGGISSTALTVTAEEHRFLAQQAAQAAGIEVRHLLEPASRNTAPAMAAAALAAHADTLLLFAPADHFMPDIAAFCDAVHAGVPAAQDGYLVTLGIAPSHPSTAYGYIGAGERIEGMAARRVHHFTEKPDAATAQRLLLDGYYWNAGVFLARAGTLLDALRSHAPDILDVCRRAWAQHRVDGSFVRLDAGAFSDCRSESIDYAVMEKHDRVAVVPYAGRWSDVGSWNSLAELTPADTDGNRVNGQAYVMEAQDCYVHAPHRPVVVLGVKGVVIVDTPDAVLVAAASHSEKVKETVAMLERAQVPQAITSRRQARPWGSYDEVDDGERFKVKRITVNPGASLSLQMHHHRAEHWVVVKGTARVTRGEQSFLMTENQSTYIPLGTVHRLENPGKTPLELIEVQSGGYLGEDDIIRFVDTYGRNCGST